MMPAMASVILYDTLNGITYDGVANAQLNLLKDVYKRQTLLNPYSAKLREGRKRRPGR